MGEHELDYCICADKHLTRHDLIRSVQESRLGKYPHRLRLQSLVRTLPSVGVWSYEDQASDNGFQQFVTRFQAIEITSQNQADPLILADANARAIHIDLATADALPAFKNFSHYLDSTFSELMHDWAAPSPAKTPQEMLPCFIAEDTLHEASL